MPRVRLSQQAQIDFDNIIDYLARNAGQGVAMRYGRDIRLAINQLPELPYIGSRRPSLGEHMRTLIVHPYLIFYDPDSFGGIVHVFRILHGARDIDDELVRKGRE